MKKLFLLIFLSLTVAGNMMGQSLPQDASGNYLIGSAEDLVAFSNYVNGLNGQSQNLGANGLLTADIDMSSVDNFAPIGLRQGSGKQWLYSGTFDGQGHTISNLTIDGANFTFPNNETGKIADIGLFGRTNGAKISNVGIINCTLRNANERGGCIVGEGVGTTVTNCYAFGTIIIENVVNRDGGIAGETSNGKLVGCITTYSKLLGQNSTTERCYIGTEEEAHSGALCYKANGDQSNITYYQAIGTDEYPTLNSISGQVFESATYNCGGQPLGGVHYTNVNSGQPILPPHTMDEELGMCTTCQAYFAEPDKEGDYYLLAKPGHLGWFAQQVNEKGQENICAKLISDIDMSSVDNFTPIGLFCDFAYTQSPYNLPRHSFTGGHFDGQGHVISNLTIDMNKDYEVGFFSRASGATIENVGFYNATIRSSSSNKHRGSVLAGFLDNCTTRNVYSCGTIVVDTWKENGVCGGIVGIKSNGTLSNSYTTYGNVTGGGSTINCYCSGDSPQYGTGYTEDQLVSGELCYKLNGDQTGIIYYQNLDEKDSYPTLNSTHGQVYKNVVIPSCDGKEVTEYSNVEKGAPVKPAHNFMENGICNVCAGGEEPNQDGDGFYEIRNAGHIEWFSAKVALGGDANMQSKAKLMNDIDMTDVNHTPIGATTSGKFNGVFDGQGHRIKNMIINRPTENFVGFFGWLRGNGQNTEIRNLIIDKSCSITAKSYVAGIAGAFQNSGNTIILKNIVNEANVTAVEEIAGGLLGGVLGDSPTWQVSNFLNTGNITAAGNVGAVAGLAGNAANSTFDKILNIGTVEGGEGNNLGNMPGSVTNVFDLAKTDEDVTSGKVANMLGWGQLINTDACPSPLSEETVYAVSAAGYATMVATEDTKLNGDAQAYIGKVNGQYLTLTEVDDIPEGEAVVVKGTYYNKVACTATADFTGNELVAATSDVTSDGSQYALAKKNDVVGFYKVKADIVIPAGKAYLQVGSAAAKAYEFFGFGDDDTATGIEMTTDNGQLSTEIFNLSGQRMSKAQKGINIINGKKVLY